MPAVREHNEEDSDAGSTIVTSEEEAVAEARATGFPVLLKATGGGGGIGIYICHNEKDVTTNFAAAGRHE